MLSFACVEWRFTTLRCEWDVLLRCEFRALCLPLTPMMATNRCFPSVISMFAVYPQRRSVWADDSSDNEPLPSGSRWSRGRGSLWLCRTPDSTGKENDRPGSPTRGAANRGTAGGLEQAQTPCSSATRISQAGTCLLSPASSGRDSWGRGLSKPTRTVATMRDGPAAVLHSASLPVSGCLHEGEGKTWVPGGLMTWQPSKRRARAAASRRRGRTSRESVESENNFSSVSITAACSACTSGGVSVYGVQVSSDGRGILMASRDATVTLWDAQSREVVYRFGHSRLSMRARPILSEGASNGGGRGWGRIGGGGGRGDVFAGTKDGEVRAWRVGSQFPNRVFKLARWHDGFEITCVAASRDGGMFASADSSGKVCVQSASAGRYELDVRERHHEEG